jgi:hypothetical protein
VQELLAIELLVCRQGGRIDSVDAIAKTTGGGNRIHDALPGIVLELIVVLVNPKIGGLRRLPTKDVLEVFAGESGKGAVLRCSGRFFRGL